MKKLLTFLICLPLLTLGQQTINESITHGGLQRDYTIHIPSSYNVNTPIPLVFCFHGYGSNASTIMSYTNFNYISDTAGFIVVYPQGTLLQGTTHWNVGGWTIGSTIDDVGFTASLLDSISNTYTIDDTRVYSTGMSNGGYMSFLLACQLSDKIAAIASVTGSMTPQTYNACNPQHPTPILQIHGTSDQTVPYVGDPTWTKSIDDVLQYWVAYNNCNTSAIITAITDINIFDGSTAELIVYDGGDNNVTTEHFKIYGGDHDWPGVWGNMDIHASAEVWKFFSRYNINGLINPTVLPMASISGNDTICYNQNIDAQVTVSFGGATPPFSFIYAINGVSQPSITTNVNPYVISTQQAGTYTLTSFSDALAVGSISGAALVTVNTSPIDCPPPLLIQEHTTNKELLKITDILGKETTLKNNTLLFYIYDDGTVEKRIVVE